MTPRAPLGPGPITVLTSRVGADEKKLFAELDRRGLAHEQVDTRTLRVPSDAPRITGHVVLNREIGQFRAAYAARSLEALGATVVNSAAATDVCGDKWRTTLALRAAGLPTPRTALGLTPDSALSALEEIGYPAVIKPLVGSWGRLVASVPDPAVARSLLDHVAALPSPQSHVVYVQELVAKPDRDIRAIVVDGEVLGATYRHGSELRTNVALGATVEPCPLTPELTSLAVGAAAAVGADVAGVDLIESDGVPLVLEVNHRVEFSGFEQAHGVRLAVAERVIDAVVRRRDELAACQTPVERMTPAR